MHRPRAALVASHPDVFHPRAAAKAAALALGAVLVAAGTAARAEVSPYYIGVSESITHDSNLLRLGDGQPLTTAASQSDTVANTSLLAGFDQPFGRQRGWGNVSVRDSRYSKNNFFNNIGYTGSVGLDWSTVERISGTLSASANRSLTNFDYNNAALGKKDLETTTALNAGVRLGLVTEYSVEGNYGHRDDKHSLDVARPRNFRQDTGSLGLRWNPRAATSGGLALRQTRGIYPDFLALALDLAPGQSTADRYRENAIDLTGTVQPGGASSFDGRLSYSKTSYDLNQRRDFSGLTGTLGWVWQPTAKLRLDSRVSRDTGQNSYAVAQFNVLGTTSVPGTSDYSQLLNTLRVRADYQATAKITAYTGIQIVQRRIVNTVFDANTLQGSDVQSGRDRSTLFSLGARWAPLRSVLLGCDFSFERRTASNDQPVTAQTPAVSFPLTDRIFGCYGQFQLQQ